MGPDHLIQVLKKIDKDDIIQALCMGYVWEICSQQKTYVSTSPVDKSENTSAKEKRILKTMRVQRRARNGFLSIF